jgi:hypothetical protein
MVFLDEFKRVFHQFEVGRLNIDVASADVRQFILHDDLPV